MTRFCGEILLVFDTSSKFCLSLFATLITPALILFVGNLLLDHLTLQGEYVPMLQGLVRPFGFAFMGLAMVAFFRLTLAMVDTYQRERDRLLGLPRQRRP
jgi:hypothetical protein